MTIHRELILDNQFIYDTRAMLSVPIVADRTAPSFAVTAGLCLNPQLYIVGSSEQSKGIFGRQHGAMTTQSPHSPTE